MYKDKNHLLYNLFFIELLQSVYLHQGDIDFEHNIKIYVHTKAHNRRTITLNIQKPHTGNLKLHMYIYQEYFV